MMLVYGKLKCNFVLQHLKHLNNIVLFLYTVILEIFDSFLILVFSLGFLSANILSESIVFYFIKIVRILDKSVKFKSQ